MIVVDPELSAAPPFEALKALYGLTAAEARLTCGLLKGERLEDYAERTGISMNTARTHLKAVLPRPTPIAKPIWCACSRTGDGVRTSKSREPHPSG